MKYDKNLINDLFDIKEELDDDKKAIVERFIEQYNKMYATYRITQEEKGNTRKLYNENAKMKEQIKSYKHKITELENQILLGG